MPALRPSFANSVQALQTQNAQKGQAQQANNPRQTWIEQAKMLVNLVLTMKNNKDLLEELLEELEKRGVSLEFLNDVDFGKEKSSGSLALLLALKVAEILENFFQRVALEAMQKANPEAKNAGNPAPAYSNQLDALALELNNLKQFNLNQAQELEVEDEQQDELNLDSNQQMQNQAAAENQGLQNSEEKSNSPSSLKEEAHTLLKTEHVALKLAAVLEMAPKMAAGVAKEALEEGAKFAPAPPV